MQHSSKRETKGNSQKAAIAVEGASFIGGHFKFIPSAVHVVTETLCIKNVPELRHELQPGHKVHDFVQ